MDWCPPQDYFPINLISTFYAFNLQSIPHVLKGHKSINHSLLRLLPRYQPFWTIYILFEMPVNKMFTQIKSRSLFNSRNMLLNTYSIRVWVETYGIHTFRLWLTSSKSEPTGSLYVTLRICNYRKLFGRHKTDFWLATHIFKNFTQIPNTKNSILQFLLSTSHWCRVIIIKIHCRN